LSFRHSLAKLLIIANFSFQALLEFPHVLLGLVKLELGLAEGQQHQGGLLLVGGGHVLKHDLALLLNELAHVGTGVQDSAPLAQLGHLVLLFFLS